MKELYVGNLLPSVTLSDVTDLFSQYGTIYDARLIAQREPGRPHAYAFVEMDDDAANAAIEGLGGTDYMGLTLLVEESRPDTAPM